MIGNGYLVVGTVERKDWRRGLAKPLSNGEMLAALHDFKDHLDFQPAPQTRAEPLESASVELLRSFLRGCFLTLGMRRHEHRLCFVA
jgi:hypothetical protein